MKKQILTIAAFAGLSAASFAQDAPTSKNGYTVLPESGDYAIQMDATPILDFALNAVNIMNNTGNTAQHPGYVSGFNQTLVGKYFLSESQAVRGKVAINTGASTTKTFGFNPVTQTGVDGDTTGVLLSTEKNRTVDVLLAGGLEWRRGHNRLQGFYGGEVFLGFGSSGSVTKYEIEYSQVAEDSSFISNGSNRELSEKSGLSITFGLRGFAGVEYFILPKISIGAEFGWGFGITTNPRSKIETEYWDDPTGSGSNSQRVIESEGGSSGSSMGFQVDNGTTSALGGSAALTATFHF